MPLSADRIPRSVGLPLGVAADNRAGNVVRNEPVSAEMRQAWIAQNPEWAPTTSDGVSPAPWMLQQQENGTLTFSHHATVHLEDYALPVAPLNGTQSTPLRADQNDACFIIHAPGQNRSLSGQGGRVYRVTRQQFAVRTVLPMALTGTDLEPVALMRGTDNRMTVAPQAPQLLQFLTSFYAVGEPVQGSVTQGGDALIRGNGRTWCLIDGRPFEVSCDTPGKYYIIAPNVTLMVVKMSRKPEALALQPETLERQLDALERQFDVQQRELKRQLDDLCLERIDVERKNNRWQMKPSAANGRSFLTFLAPSGCYGVTTEPGSHTGHGFRHAGMTFPYERQVEASAGHITLPAVTDPAGNRPPVPLDRYRAAGFGGETGFYAVHSSKTDENAVRPAMTLDTMTGREKAGFVLKFLALAVDSPFRTIRELWGDTVGDMTSRRKLWKAVMNDGWEQDNEVGTAVASLADFIYHNLFGSAEGWLGYTATMGALKGLIRGGGKALMNQTLTRQDMNDMEQGLGNIVFGLKLKELPSGGSMPAWMQSRDTVQGQKSLVRHLITPALHRSPELPYDNLFRNDVTGTTWLHEAAPRAGSLDYPHPLERNGDLYMQKVPDGVQGYEAAMYLSEGGRLRPLTKEEADLNRHLVRVSGENVPGNLYRDPRTGWQYVRETDAQGVRLADRAVGLHDTATAAAGYDLYEVPGSGELLREENGRLRPLTGIEARERAGQLPSEGTLNAANYEKVYVINGDGSRTVEYAPKLARNSPQQQNGRSTYRYDANSRSWRQTGKSIDADGRVLSMPGGGPKKQRVLSSEQTTFLDNNEALRKGPQKLSARALAGKWLDHKVELQAQDILQEQLASYHGINPVSLSTAIVVEKRIRLPLKQEQEALLNTLLKGPNDPLPAELAGEWLDHEAELQAKKIFPEQLAVYRRMKNPGSLKGAIAVERKLRASLTEPQKVLVDELLPGPNDPLTSELAGKWLDHEDELKKAGIFPQQLAVYRRMKNPGNLATAISRLRKARAPLNVQQETLIDTLLPGPDEPTASELAADWLEHEDELKKAGISPQQLAVYRRMKTPSTLTNEISLQRKARVPLNVPQKALVNRLLQGVDSSSLTELARVWLDHEVELQEAGILPPQLATSGIKKPKLLYNAIALQRKARALPNEQQEALINTLLQGVDRSSPTELAGVWLDNEVALKEVNITPELLATHCGMKALFNEIRLQRKVRVPLTELQVTLLNSLPQGSGKPSEIKLVKEWLDHEVNLQAAGITPEQLATYRGLKKLGGLRSEINLQSAARIPLEPEQKVFLDGHNTLRKRPEKPSATALAGEWLDHEDELEAAGITPQQLAAYRGLETQLSSLRAEIGRQRTAQLLPIIKQEVLPPDNANKIALITLEDTDQGEVIIRQEVRYIAADKLDELPVVDNSLPILHDGGDPPRSLTLEAESVSNANDIPATSVRWLELNSELNNMPPSGSAAIRAALIAEFRRQITNERSLAADMERIMETRQASYTSPDGERVSLGNGVFNPGPGQVKKFTVLGPFAGKFEDTPQAISQAQRQLGTVRTASHSWATRLSNPSRGVNGFKKGNILRNLNTAKLGDAPAVGDNNVAIVKFGKNLIFYVTIKDVDPDAQYFVNYGTAYNPHELTGGQRVKTEPLDQE